MRNPFAEIGGASRASSHRVDCLHSGGACGLGRGSDPSGADRRLMLAVKQNLGPNVGGLAFRVETQNGLPVSIGNREP